MPRVEPQRLAQVGTCPRQLPVAALEIGEQREQVRPVGRAGGTVEGALQQHHGSGGAPVQLLGVGVAGEHLHAGPAAVGLRQRSHRCVVAAELGERVDPHRQCADLVRVDRQRRAGQPQRTGEVVPGCSQRGLPGQRKAVVVGLQLDRPVERALGPRVVGGVCGDPGLLDVGEPEGGPAARVLRLLPQVVLQQLHGAAEVAGARLGERGGVTDADHGVGARRLVRDQPQRSGHDEHGGQAHGRDQHVRARSHRVPSWCPCPDVRCGG